MQTKAPSRSPRLAGQGAPRRHPRPGQPRGGWTPALPGRGFALPARGLILILALVLGMLTGGTGAARAEGTVTTPTTAALLEALLGGGVVRLAYVGTNVLEIPLIIAADTVIQGDPNAEKLPGLSGGKQRRILRVLPGIRLELRNCVLLDGLATNGGAVLNEGILLASNVTFAACSALGADGSKGRDGEDRFGFGEDGRDGTSGAPAAGGAVFNAGEATFVACRFQANLAQGGKGGDGGKGGVGGAREGTGGDGGPGAPASGGAVANTGSLAIDRSVLVDNSAFGGSGGAGGSNGSTLRAGQGGGGASAAGGAIHSTGPFLLARSALANNWAVGGNSAPAGAPTVNVGRDGAPGGHAQGGAVASWATGGIVNTTFYTNLVFAGAGGDGAAGLFTIGSGGNGGNAVGSAVHARGSLGITNATFAWNIATNGAGGAAGVSGLLFSRDGDPGFAGGSGIAADSGAAVAVVNSILAAGALSTVHGAVLDQGHNLFTDGGTGSRVEGSLYSTDPRLSTYAVWTSGTPGFVLLAGSPALDAAHPLAAPPDDQRGLPRPVGAGPDIGAMEEGAATFLILGRVLDGDRGLSGVGVRVGDVSTATDTEGRFRFGPLPGGFYTVELVGGGAGFVPRLIQIPLVADATNVVFRTQPVALALARDPALGINTLSATGVPQRFYRLEGGADLGTWESLGGQSADAQGRVLFHHETGAGPRWFYRLVAP